MTTGFDKYWDDTKKHKKRVAHWLPHAKGINSQINNMRSFRYFTLCAREMIDVFMLAKEEVLQFDAEQAIITHVRFCESDSKQYDEIKEMVGREDAGFYGELENLVLYGDDNFTAQFPTSDSIEAALEDEGLDISRRESLQTKRTHLNLRSSFPYDFVNLDFCGYYYPPPNILKINQSVEKILDWQREVGTPEVVGEPTIKVDNFLLSVTCRYDREFPEEARRRLMELMKRNIRSHLDYKQFVETTRGIADLDVWMHERADDFFLSIWPKEIARLAQRYEWDMEILEYVHYDRVSDEEQDYKIICLVARFVRASSTPNYLRPAMYALEQSNRKFIAEIAKNTQEGRSLMTNLAGIVDLRNRQAKRKGRAELPVPAEV